MITNKGFTKRDFFLFDFRNCIFCDTPISIDVLKRPYCMNCCNKYWRYILMFKAMWKGLWRKIYNGRI